MKALILNSGLGRRMGALTEEHPKCMTEIDGESILSRQLRMIAAAGIREVVVTTGYYDKVLVDYCNSIGVPLQFKFVKNPIYDRTNYIYSIWCARDFLKDDVVLMHGDIVFEEAVFARLLASKESCMVVSSALPLPEKDFKAVIENGTIRKVGIEFFENALAAQPLYLIKQHDLDIWMESIGAFVERGDLNCYAENALNVVSDRCKILPLDVKNLLCNEIDTPKDLEAVTQKLAECKTRTVYMCFSTDVIHSGHIAILKRARRLGNLIVGVLTDKAVMSYKQFPVVPYEERRSMLENIAGVTRVVAQDSLSYRENLLRLRPDFVVHGDDWRVGNQRPIRDETEKILESYGGMLIEFPYSNDEKYRVLDANARVGLSLPDIRRARLKRSLEAKGLITALEVHSGITGLIAENTVVYEGGGAHQFDAMWVSSLCDSTAKGKPDIELVDMTSRFRTIDDVMEVTTKPIIFDGDTGGLTEHFVYTVKSLERMGVSMVIIEDKKGLKKNSLFGTEVEQTQAGIEEFCEKIRAGKLAQKTRDFMICARIESLILERGMEDALTRAKAFAEAGADAIMIHSRKKSPDEIFEFVEKFRAFDGGTPLVVVPTSFNQVTEEEFKARGVNVVIYANQLTRSGFPAMQRAAQSILAHHRAKECDEEMCMPIKDIITLIPEET